MVFVTACAAIGYIYSIASASIGVMLLLLTWLIYYKENNFKKILKLNQKHFLLVFYFFLIIGLFYSLDLKQGLKDVLRFLSFLIFPLIFLTIKPFNKKEEIIIIKVFVWSVMLFFLICLSNAIYRQVKFSSEGGIFNWYFFYRYDFLEIFNQHPTYISMFSLLSISMILSKGNEIFRNITILYLMLFLQILAIILYGSRIAYIILFLLSMIWAYKNIRKTPKQLFYYMFFIICVSIVSWNIPIVKERILFSFGYKQNYVFNNEKIIENGVPESTGRFLLWKDAIDLIVNKPYFGYGTGSAKTVLLKKYELEGHHIFYNNKYNVHNTYLELLLVGGLPLLLIYLAMLGSLAIQAIKRSNLIIATFFLIITLVSFTETIFRSQGVVFVAFFYCFLLSREND